jgi:hypothetical protein
MNTAGPPFGGDAKKSPWLYLSIFVGWSLGSVERLADRLSDNGWKTGIPDFIPAGTAFARVVFANPTSRPLEGGRSLIWSG